MFKRARLHLVIVIGASFLLGGCTLRNAWDKKPSGLDITTLPKAKVFLDDKEVGETPYKNDNIKSGQYVLKLVPEASSSGTLTPWETKLTLSPQVTTIISRTFSTSPSDVESSFLQLQPEKGSNSAFLSVISDPDTVNVTIDSKPHGFTPLSKLDLAPGNHTLSISSPGYKSQSLSVNTVKGYNLLVSLKLSAESYDLGSKVEATPTSTPSSSLLPTLSPTPTPTATPVGTSSASQSQRTSKPYVVINDTPDTQSLGGLNVRLEPNSSSTALGLAKIGDQLPYLSTNATGWHEITYQGKHGWVSGKYTSVVK